LKKVWVVGVGPGDKDYITLKALKLLKEADYIAGFKATLSVIKEIIDEEKFLEMSYKNEREILFLLKEKVEEGKKCIICCYGDPNFSDKQFIVKIKDIFKELEIIPGISSIQVACSRAGIAMEDSLFITFHKSGDIEMEKEELLKNLGYRHIIILPRPWDFMPKDIAKFLLEKAKEDLEVLVYENLTLKGEKEYKGKLKDLLNQEFKDMCIMIIMRKDLWRYQG